MLEGGRAPAVAGGRASAAVVWSHAPDGVVPGAAAARCCRGGLPWVEVRVAAGGGTVDAPKEGPAAAADEGGDAGVWWPRPPDGLVLGAAAVASRCGCGGSARLEVCAARRRRTTAVAGGDEPRRCLVAAPPDGVVLGAAA